MRDKQSTLQQFGLNEIATTKRFPVPYSRSFSRQVSIHHLHMPQDHQSCDNKQEFLLTQLSVHRLCCHQTQMKETVNNAMNKHKIVTLCYLSCFRAIIHLGQLNCRCWYLGLRPTLPSQGRFLVMKKDIGIVRSSWGKLTKFWYSKKKSWHIQPGNRVSI